MPGRLSYTKNNWMSDEVGKQRFPRPSGALADDLLFNLLGRARGLKWWKNFNPEKEISSLETQRDCFADFGIAG
jgi:hypothetical protein